MVLKTRATLFSKSVMTRQTLLVAQSAENIFSGRYPLQREELFLYAAENKCLDSILSFEMCC